MSRLSETVLSNFLQTATGELTADTEPRRGRVCSTRTRHAETFFERARSTRMRRRRYLALAATGLLGGLAGAGRLLADDADSDAPAGRNESSSTSDGEPVTASTPPAGAGSEQEANDQPQSGDLSLPVPESELDRAAPRDGIPAIVDPVFDADWQGTDHDIATDAYPSPSLSPDDRVIGVRVGEGARAYPLKLLRRHEVVNDTFGHPLLVTYCPVCKSGLVADRRVDGEARTFGVSGFLFRANLVLYDRATESLWSQLLATAIRGPDMGTELALVGSTTTTWGAWREEYPDTEVLLPPPVSGTVVGDVALNYDLDPYEDHERVSERYPEYGPLGDLEWSDTRLPRRAEVLGVSYDGEAVAYPREQIRWNGPINDNVGGKPVVVAAAPDSTLVAYDRRVEGEELQFSAGDDGTLLAGGSRWRTLTGEAIAGPHDGARLDDAADAGALYWAAWLSFHPETTVWGDE